MATDPVCGMKVEEKAAAAMADYRGQTYYFCSESCHRTFTSAPQKYAGSMPADSAGEGGRQPHGRK